MSWSDDVRCLYCDGRLPLYRKITHGQFCSSAHRKAYWQEQERLAVERLSQTHDSLQAYRDLVPIGSSLPLAAPALEPEDWREPEVQEPPFAGLVQVEGALPWPPDYKYMPWDDQPAAWAADLEVDLPVVDLALATTPEAEVGTTLAEEVREPLPAMDSDAPFAEWMYDLVPGPALDSVVDVAAAMRGAMEFPPSECLLVAPGAAELPVSLVLAGKVEAHWKAARPLNQWRADVTAGLEEDLRTALAAPVLLHDAAQAATAMRLAGPVQYSIRLEPVSETGSRNYVEAQLIPPGDIAMPAANLVFAGAFGDVPSGVALLALPVNGKPLNDKRSLQPAAVTHPGSVSALYGLPQPPKVEPILPHSGCQPLDTKPVSDEFPEADLGEKWGRPAAWKQTTKHLAGFWKNAPRDLRMLVIAIPVLIALVFHPFPKVSVRAPQSEAITGLLGAQLANVKQSLRDRAAVALDEDFRSGLDGWVSRSNATADWSFDRTGFVQPGPLALYEPSMGLSDYQMQFLGMIDQKAMSWVVRAADFENYYVIKLVVLKSGPLPEIGVTRYAVIDGKAQDRADAVVPISARPDMLYRVRLDVSGKDFLLEVQGQTVDSWSEPRLRRGGIGFFSARGEQSRVRWVQVTHQYDMLGRLCAYLAPYNIPTNGSW